VTHVTNFIRIKVTLFQPRKMHSLTFENVMITISVFDLSLAFMVGVFLAIFKKIW